MKLLALLVACTFAATMAQPVVQVALYHESLCPGGFCDLPLTAPCYTCRIALAVRKSAIPMSPTPRFRPVSLFVAHSLCFSDCIQWITQDLYEAVNADGVAAIVVSSLRSVSSFVPFLFASVLAAEAPLSSRLRSLVSALVFLLRLRRRVLAF
jgi:hypothetical protein